MHNDLGFFLWAAGVLIVLMSPGLVLMVLKPNDAA